VLDGRVQQALECVDWREYRCDVLRGRRLCLPEKVLVGSQENLLEVLLLTLEDRSDLLEVAAALVGIDLLTQELQSVGVLGRRSRQLVHKELKD
jgi:hypothetical protein